MIRESIELSEDGYSKVTLNVGEKVDSNIVSMLESRERGLGKGTENVTPMGNMGEEIGVLQIKTSVESKSTSMVCA